MKTFYAAHNEYLELLLTTGVAGLAAWLWFVAAHLRKAAPHGLSMQQNVKKRKLCCFLQRFDIIIVIVKSQQNHLF